MKFSLIMMIVAVVALVACTAPTDSGSENLVPSDEYVSISKAKDIAKVWVAEQPEYEGYRYTGYGSTGPDKKSPAGFTDVAEKAWEVRFNNAKTQRSLFVYVSTNTGDVFDTREMDSRDFGWGQENLVPTGETPTVTQEQAQAIADDYSEGTYEGSRLVHAVPDGAQARGLAQLAWEVRYVRNDGKYADLIYVSAVSGEVLRTHFVPVKTIGGDNAENLLPGEVADEYGVPDASVTLVHAKPISETGKESPAELAYEVRIERPDDGKMDLIYISVETGEVIRSTTKRLGSYN
ncbi:PepSY domain-containing protein [Candidatus Woesearchaeota archaeon]|nr:PepSY domain-containing protein [Candidatus Woesearchaeota archaeon]